MDSLIFAIETSCDETSVAIINNQGKILSHITVNQENHNKFGGVVPEIASRAHLQILQTIIPQSFKKAKIDISKRDVKENPYAELPRMNMCIIKIPDEIRRISLKG